MGVERGVGVETCVGVERALVGGMDSAVRYHGIVFPIAAQYPGHAPCGVRTPVV